MPIDQWRCCRLSGALPKSANVNAGNTALVIKLENGSTYCFRGSSKEVLQIETPSGLHNAQLRDGGNSNVFAWSDRGQAQRLAVRLETA